MSDDKITGKVARIVSDKSVVLNRGKLHGIKVGHYVGILDSHLQKIQDPDTHEDLGGIRVFKIALRVEQVSDRLCVASTYKTYRENHGGTGSSVMGAMAMLTPPRWVEVQESLVIGENDARPIEAEESKVQEGDSFEVISEDEAENLFTFM